VSEIRDEGDAPACFGCGGDHPHPSKLTKVEIETENLPVMLCPTCVAGLVACERCGKTQALDEDDFDQVLLYPETREEPPEWQLICGACGGETM
jgi:hypothetical protein